MNPEQPAAVVVLPDHLTRADVPRLCAQLHTALAASPTAPADCDASAAVQPDLITIEALARLALTARRAGGRRLRLHKAPPELRALLELVGLGELARAAGEDGPDPARQRSATE
ncbi:STAS domain-containing protein [Streptomyces sp. SID9124]|uniref:STAS domain-containing protein n=1 Tax=Streptomyces sp. SID9124 TaxID=2706108 RepID=UPI0013DE8F91|nr:STAS domain-containing protein [Streptomyces sp. SID9124]NED14367.1 STAS domain-containing protein [Streptomyces sp. SID9124]